MFLFLVICNRDSFKFVVLFTGNTSLVSDEEFSAAFVSADGNVNKAVCSPTVRTVSVLRRLNRRRLQTVTTTTTFQYVVGSSQTSSTVSLYESSADTDAFINGLNAYETLKINGIVGTFWTCMPRRLCASCPNFI